MECFVFVYGSLKNGFGNHDFLNGAEFITSTQTKDHSYQMVSLGSFPAVLSGGSCAISGELYKADSSTLILLDMLEGNGDLYERQEVKFESGHTAWMYVFLYEVETPAKNTRVLTVDGVQTWLSDKEITHP